MSVVCSQDLFRCREEKKEKSRKNEKASGDVCRYLNKKKSPIIELPTKRQNEKIRLGVNGGAHNKKKRPIISMMCMPCICSPTHDIEQRSRATADLRTFEEQDEKCSVAPSSQCNQAIESDRGC